MPRLKLTEKAITKLHAPTASGKQEIFWDAELRGFGVLLSGVSNSRSYIVQRDLKSGKTRRVTIAAVNEMALADAKDKARELLVDMRQGIDPKAKTAGTLQETFDAYLKANKDIRPRTRELYASLVRLHLAPWHDRALASITPAEVDAMHRAIAANVAKRGQHSGHSVANDAVCLFRLLYNFAARRDDELPRNPVRLRGSEWHKVTPERNPIDFDKLSAWYAAVMRLPPMGRDYLLLLLFTGFRRREAAALRWDEIDFGQRVIRLPAARRALGNATYVFPSYSRKGHIQDARPWTDMVAEASGVKFTLHDLRRTFVTVAESADISVHSLKALVNHSLGSGVTESYIKMSAERLREPVQKVCDKLKELCGISTPRGDKVTALR